MAGKFVDVQFFNKSLPKNVFFRRDKKIKKKIEIQMLKLCIFICESIFLNFIYFFKNYLESVAILAMSPVNKVFHEKGAQYFVTLLYFFERKCCKKVLYKRGTSMFFTTDYRDTFMLQSLKQ